MSELAGKVVIVTGGATGIGRGICRLLASHGVRIAIVQRDVREATSAAMQIEGARGFGADVRSLDQVQAMVSNVIAEFGNIDGLINNAAVTGHAALCRFVDMKAEQSDQLIDTNLKGTIWCSQAVAQHMISTGSKGSIIHIASVGAFAAQDMAAVYCATKAAQVMLAKAMALELAPHGIRVNAIAPGDILTDLNADIVTDMKTSGVAEQYIRKTPIGRRGTTQDIGESVVFLLSEKAAFITGTTLTVDGGLMTY